MQRVGMVGSQKLHSYIQQPSSFTSFAIASCPSSCCLHLGFQGGVMVREWRDGETGWGRVGTVRLRQPSAFSLLSRLETWRVVTLLFFQMFAASIRLPQARSVRPWHPPKSRAWSATARSCHHLLLLLLVAFRVAG
jgi:hypothetical protein